MTHKIIIDKGKDYYLSEDKVLHWIFSNEQELPFLKRDMKNNVKGAISEYHYRKAYIKEMKYYLRTGTWISDCYGENQEFKTYWRVIYG